MSNPPEILGQLIKRAQHANHRALDAALDAVGLSLVQWNALREIERNPGASMRRLAELTFNSDQGFGALVARLLRDGLLERLEGPGRALAHRLTREGEAKFRRGLAIHGAVAERSFSGLDAADRDLLARLLQKLLDANEPRVDSAPAKSAR